MSDVREVLDGIEKRAVNGPISDWDPRGGDEPHHRVIERTIEFEKRLRADNASLVAALRAVLDDCNVADRLTQGEGTALVSTARIRAAITEALGGGA